MSGGQKCSNESWKTIQGNQGTYLKNSSQVELHTAQQCLQTMKLFCDCVRRIKPIFFFSGCTERKSCIAYVQFGAHLTPCLSQISETPNRYFSGGHSGVIHYFLQFLRGSKW
jgi:hypothetical protein